MKRDGLRWQHHDNRTCAPTNLPPKNSHDAAMLDYEPTKRRRDATTQELCHAVKQANAANQKPAEAVEQEKR